jgi:PAS domain S-box-containing protein
MQLIDSKIEKKLLDNFKNKKRSKNITSSSLVEQYKQMVDQSSIVSKTNPKGIITYVNDEFCKISGYAKNELIGKPHNIVRHHSVAKSFYEKMWKRIKFEKKPWSGVVKNIRKDGTLYWVKSTISPIFDHNNNIIEYISLRTDITEQEQIKLYLKEELNITSNKFTNLLHIKKQYEDTINKNNIVFRVNLKREITHCNKKFTKITGYSLDEIEGRNFTKIIDKDYKSNKILKEIFATIKSGNIWKGVLNNRSKLGKTYWVKTTIVPIKNNLNQIFEYMIVMQNITEVFELHSEINSNQKELIFKMSEICESRSKETGNHVRRVALYSKLFAQLLGMSKEQTNLIYTASPMHDIGKVGISDSILHKDDRLTIEEMLEMRKHCEIGYEILNCSKRPVLKTAATVAYEHHEKWDGSGYPRGLKGEQISIFARITAVADVFDALGSDRSYKKAWDDEKIFNLFQKEKAKQFDPTLIDLFFENLESFLKIRDTLKD